MSIQEFLEKKGYVASLDEGVFTKWQTGWQRVAIPFTALSGHTLESFQEMMKRKGWAEESEAPKDYFGELVGMGIFSWGRRYE